MKLPSRIAASAFWRSRIERPKALDGRTLIAVHLGHL
jgi:hypothetical protein